MLDRSAYTYAGEQLREIAFPLGGIGTGCVSLDGRGALCDWELFGRPNIGHLLPMAFPTLWCQAEGEAPQARVVQGPRQREFVGPINGFWSYGQGRLFEQADGLPCFTDVAFQGEYPVAAVTMKHPNCPIEVVLTAYNPFIPLDSRSSSFPAASLTYKLTNRSDKTVRATLAWNMTNPVGEMAPEDKEHPDRAVNRYRKSESCQGIEFTNARFAPGELHAGTASLTTTWGDVTYAERWEPGEWFDPMQRFWTLFSEKGELDSSTRSEEGPRLVASLGLRVTLKPGESADLPFLIAWSFPTATKYWDDGKGPKSGPWTHWYATQWPTAWAAAEEFSSRQAELWRRTNAYVDALYGSTLPTEVIESIGATSSTLKSTTCIRLEDGTFWAWEGCSPDCGCCDGSCSHVWNYALTHAFLFPDLQRSMRRSEYKNSFNCGPEGAKGALIFRQQIPLGAECQLWHAASDGQLGGVVQLYRDWQLCGDDDYLREMWPSAKKALEYAWVQWDRDRDGLVDGDMHNTYDINFQGPNPLTQMFYMAALRAGEEMSRYLGDEASARVYRDLFEKGWEKTEEVIWNGEFFVQTIDCLAEGAPKYQHGLGCLSDQVFGQLAAHVAGLGYVADPPKVRRALESIFKYNFRDPLGDHANLQRVYAVQDESGLLACSWPNGSRPPFPFPYSDEVWTGMEYQVASHMIFEGLVDEGLAIVKAVRKRYDGRRRNPYNEFECGSHYARALSAYGLLPALSGFHYDRSTGTATADPKVKADGPFRCFFSTGTAWGTFTLVDGKVTLNVIEGSLQP